jgi:predicted regulator of amino acid metabolism with ACT domain
MIEIEIKDGFIIPQKTTLKDGIYIVNPKNQDLRTIAQNRALWKWLSEIANKLNNENLYITNIIKSEVEWNKDSVKNIIFDPVMKALYNKKSSTELQKKDFDLIIDNIVNIFAKKGIEIPEFPAR